MKIGPSLLECIFDKEKNELFLIDVLLWNGLFLVDASVNKFVI